MSGPTDDSGATGPLPPSELTTRWWFAVRRQDLSQTEFVHRWSSDHARLASGLEGLRGYTQHHSLGGRPSQDNPAAISYDGCAEMRFPSRRHMDVAFEDELASRLDEDEARFVEPGSPLGAVTRTGRLLGAGQPEDFRCITVWHEYSDNARAAALGSLAADAVTLQINEPHTDTPDLPVVEVLSFSMAAGAMRALTRGALRGADVAFSLVAWAYPVVPPGRSPSR